MKYVALVLGLLLSSVALANTVTVTLANPTTNTDNTTIPAPPAAGSLVKSTVEYGTCGANHVFGTKVGQIDIAYPGTTAIVSMVVAQEYCFRANATNSLGRVSDYSNMAYTTNTPTPVPPTGLTVSADNTAYVLGQTPDRLTMVPVGKITPGTACLAQYTAMGMYAVPHSSVTFADPVADSVLVFGKCS